jgi:ABC-2 type transport system permease protein
MTILGVARSEWIKMRSLRSTGGALIAVFVVTVGIGALVCVLVQNSEVLSPDFDPLQLSFYGLAFGQVAAIAFGTLVMSQEFHDSALRIWLSAVPRRGLFYAVKIAMTGAAALGVGLLSAFTTMLLGRALLGDAAAGIGGYGAVRATVGGGIYLALMALFAGGLTALLRSGVAVLSLLIPLLLIIPFIFVDFASGIGGYLPNRAGQLIVQQYPRGPIGPWTAVGVTALWACAAVLAGGVSISRRDV